MYVFVLWYQATVTEIWISQSVSFLKSVGKYLPFFVKIYPVDANERIFKKIKLHCDLLPIKACPFENQQKCVLFYWDHNGPSILRFAVLIELDLKSFGFDVKYN